MMQPRELVTLFLLAFLSLLFHPTKGQDSANISLLDHWEDTTLSSSTIYNNTYNEVWGFVHDSTEYAVIGSTMGTHIFEVSDPENIQQVDFVPGADQGSSIIHRDFHDHQGYLYMVSDEGSSTLQIADLSPLPDSVKLVYDSDSLLKNAHNIFIDSSSSRLYACGAKTKYNSAVDLMILDISDPNVPDHLRDYENTHYFHDIFVRNDTAYGNHGTYAGLIVYDMSDFNNVDVIGTLPSYTDQGYNHSGWLSPSGDHYVMADETHGMRMKLLNVEDLSNIQEESLFLSQVDSNSIAHNPIIHDEHIFVGHYHDGVYIWNMGDPQNPVLTGFYDTYPPNDHDSYRGNWGVYPFLPSGILLASDMQSGLYVLDVDSAMSSVGLKERAPLNRSLQVWPNPAQKQIHFSTRSSLDGPVRARILDLRGRVLKSKEWSEAPEEMRMELDGSKSGLHFLELQSSKGRITKKFIKQE